MRSIVLLLLFLTVVLIAGAVLTGPAWMLLYDGDGPRVERVFMRGLQIVGFLLLPVYLKLTGAWDRDAIGLNRLHGAWRSFMVALLAGVVMLIPLILSLLVTGARVTTADPLLMTVLAYAPKALGAALGVAIMEELLFRGAILGGLRQHLDDTRAVLVGAVVFSALHFLGPDARMDPSDVTAMTGFGFLGATTSKFADPTALLSDFLALLAAGALLGVVRCRTGSVIACIGLHAGWVLTLRLFRKATDIDPLSPAAFLVGNHDNIMGFMAFFWIGLALAFLRFDREGRIWVALPKAG